MVFRDCRIDLATFAGTTFERATFDGCLLAQADFREALLRSVRFDGCDLTEADFAGVRIDRCELRGCTLDGLAGVERLRGAAMPWADIVGNAGLLAAALGIRALDEDGLAVDQAELAHHAGVVAHAPVLDDPAVVGEAHQVHLLDLEAARRWLGKPSAVAGVGGAACACGWRRARPRRPSWTSSVRDVGERRGEQLAQPVRLAEARAACSGGLVWLT